MFGALFGGLLKGGLTGIMGGVNSIVKTIFGDREAKDRYVHEQEISVQESYQAEFLAPEKKHWFNMLVDGANRLVRPFVTYSVLAMFYWASMDPVNFTYYIQTLQIVPELMWYIMGGIFLFWFGGRMIEKGTFTKSAMKIDPDAAKMVIDAHEKRKWDAENKITERNEPILSNDKYMEEMNDKTKPLSNSAIMEWNRRKKNAN